MSAVAMLSERGMAEPVYAKVIVNPRAGAGATAKRWPRVKEALRQSGVRFDYELTEAPGHATELARIAVGEGYKLVVSVGGDGTMNEIVNGLYKLGADSDVMLGIISTGTGSDYIRSLGIPRSFKDACQRLYKPEKKVVDLGMVEYMANGQKVKRIFVNFTGLGFDAEVVKIITQRFKFLGGTLFYLVGVLACLMLNRNKNITLNIDGEISERSVREVLVCNGKYGGGGMIPAPDADVADGLLDVLIIDNASKADLLWSLPRIYKGTHLTHPKVTVKKARKIEIDAGDELLVQADGELLGKAPARLWVLPAALTVAV